jgi:hypothetical protein
VEGATREVALEFFATYRVFLMPLDVEKLMLRRIESSLIVHFRAQDGRVGEFLGNKQWRRYEPLEQTTASTHSTQ